MTKLRNASNTFEKTTFAVVHKHKSNETYKVNKIRHKKNLKVLIE